MIIGMKHRNGVPWYQAPIPSRWHRCRPWTSALDDLTRVDRCACGATRLGGSEHRWLERNERRNVRRAQ